MNDRYTEGDVPTVYIGWDSRETEAFEVAEHSLRRSASGRVNVIPLKLNRLEFSGLMRRPREWVKPGMHIPLNQDSGSMVTVGNNVEPSSIMWDSISQAPMSTEFAISRFIVPTLAQKGIAIFMDCDVVVQGDVYELQEMARKQDHIALWCVQHEHRTGSMQKMDGQFQTFYRRKNWSSVMVFNCDNPSNLALNINMVNTAPGRDLHAFCWIHDRLLGQLDPEWNWLVGVTERPRHPKICHYTLGGPWLKNWEQHPYDNEWLAAQEALRAEPLRYQPGSS